MNGSLPPRSILHLGGLIALVLVAVLLALLQPVAAQQSSTTLVSNTGQARGIITSLNHYDVAQAFTTGSESSGYSVTSVGFDFSSVRDEEAQYILAIYTNSNGEPGSVVGTFDTAPESLEPGINTWSSDTGINLHPSTTYFVHLDSLDVHVTRIRSSEGNAEDAGGAEGWSIGDVGLYRNLGNEPRARDWNPFNGPFMIEIKGESGRVQSSTSTPTPTSTPTNTPTPTPTLPPGVPTSTPTPTPIPTNTPTPTPTFPPGVPTSTPTPTPISTSTSTPTPGPDVSAPIQTPIGPRSLARIGRIAPTLRSVVVSPGDKIRIDLRIFGRQDIEDPRLADDVDFEWRADDDVLAGEDGPWILYTAPAAPGRYMLTASLGPSDCHQTEASDQLEKCTAEIEVRVSRLSQRPPEEAPPVNPDGEIPSILTDSDGNQYEVFTPVGGGRFDSEDGFSIMAEPGAVPNGEFIGIRISNDSPASDAVLPYQRRTLVGDIYGIHVVGAAGETLLDPPATVCVPLPDEYRTDTSNLALVAINVDGSLTIMSTEVRIGAAGVAVCGTLSSLSASVAVSTGGAPAPIPAAEAVYELPDTGGAAPAPNAIIVMLALLGLLGMAVAFAVARTQRRDQKPQ